MAINNRERVALLVDIATIYPGKDLLAIATWFDSLDPYHIRMLKQHPKIIEAQMERERLLYGDLMQMLTE